MLLKVAGFKLIFPRNRTEKCGADDLSCSLSSDECSGNRSVWTGPAVISFHQGSQSLLPPWAAELLEHIANSQATCGVSRCCSGLGRFQLQFYPNASSSPRVCVSLTAEGQGRTLKAIQLFLAPGCAGEITLPEMHSCAKCWII